MIKKLRSQLGLVGSLFVAVYASSSSAHAIEGTLEADGLDIVFVWRDTDARDEGFTLMQAGVLESNPVLVLQLLSCLVPAGTKAVITDAGFASHDVMVIEGESSGCRGNVPSEHFKRD